MADPIPNPSSSRVSPATVERAVKSLFKWRSAKSDHEKPRLLDDDEFVYLVLTLKKIPGRDRVNSHKIPLPHPLFDAAAELCLFLDDRPGSGLTKEDAAKKIAAESVPVSKVLKLSKLRTDYRPFEAKRKLCDSYDMFLADRRAVNLLPRLLGKEFFRKKKIPVPVDLRHRNWKEQIERACSSAQLFLRTGTCSVLRVARASMSPEQVAENVAAAIEGVAAVVPRSWGNVRSFHVKMLESLALPVYEALPESRLKIDGGAKEEEKAAAMEEDVEEEAKESGESAKKKKKGRIHEVRYMDSNVGDESAEDEDGNGDEPAGKKGGAGEEKGRSKKAAKKEGSLSRKAKKEKKIEKVKTKSRVAAM